MWMTKWYDSTLTLIHLKVRVISWRKPYFWGEKQNGHVLESAHWISRRKNWRGDAIIYSGFRVLCSLVTLECGKAYLKSTFDAQRNWFWKNPLLIFRLFNPRIFRWMKRRTVISELKQEVLGKVAALFCEF